MTAQWIAYAAAVSGILALAAYAAEQVLLRWEVQARWVWVVSLAGLPMFALMGSRVALGGGAEGGGADIRVGPITVLESFGTLLLNDAPAALAAWDRQLLALWVGSSLVVAFLLTRSILSIRRLRGGWRRESVQGQPVLLSLTHGPAVVGLVRSEVVVPAWMAELPDAEQAMLLEHEMEHIRARDPWLLVCGLAALVAMPWNLATWWQVSRLRTAIEIDCDRRVLRRGGRLSAYGNLLLAVAGRGSRLPAGAVAFASRPNQLRRRVEAMTRSYRSTHRIGVAVTGALVASLALLGACQVEQPTESASVPSASGQADAAREQRDRQVTTADALSAEPAFTPYTRQPELINRSEMGLAVEEHYPPMLKDAGIGGRTVLQVFIDANGSVTNTEVVESSGHAALDAAAESSMRVARFRPAMNGDVPVAVWVQIPVIFAPGN